MKPRRRLIGALLLFRFAAAALATYEAPFTDVTKPHRPVDDLLARSMDAKPIDAEGDGDLDLMVAIEHEPDILLINDGEGRFTNESAARIPQHALDSEDVGVADLDRDDDLDIVVVGEDDRINEMHLSNGDGTFADAGDRWSVDGTSNAVVDIDGDGDPDIFVGDNGRNALPSNSGSGRSSDAPPSHLPLGEDVTENLKLGDGDGDLDLLVGNEDRNRLLINDDRGIFRDKSGTRLPVRDGREETR